MASIETTDFNLQLVRGTACMHVMARTPEYTTLHYKIMQQVSTRSAQPCTLTAGCYAGTSSCAGTDPDTLYYSIIVILDDPVCVLAPNSVKRQ